MLFSQSYPVLCDPVDCSSPGSSVHGILQARILEWVAISFSRESSLPRDPIQISCTAGRFFAIWATRETPKYQSRYGIQNAMKKLNTYLLNLMCVCVCVCVCSVGQLCSTLCDPMDCSPSDSFVHGIFQARILEWGAISYSRKSSLSRDQTHISCISCIGRQIFYHCATWEAPLNVLNIYESKQRIPIIFKCMYIMCVKCSFQ